MMNLKKWKENLTYSFFCFVFVIACKSGTVEDNVAPRPVVLPKPYSIGFAFGDFNNNNQIANFYGEIPCSIKVMVKDINGVPLQGVRVNFNIKGTNGGSLSSTSSITNVDGAASVVWTTGTAIDVYHVEASLQVDSVHVIGSPLEFTATRKRTVGDVYMGGIIAYVLVPGDLNYVKDEFHGIIAASQDQSQGIQWCNGCHWDWIRRSFVGATVTGAEGSVIGTGVTNTSLIVANQGAGTYAASICDDLELNGYNDWFLPSKGELNILYQNGSLIGLAKTSYWSSTESNKNFAHLEGSSTIEKNYPIAVRAIRYF